MRVYYTLVYRVDGDNAAHSAWWQSLQPLLMADSEPVSISAISKADEIARLDCITHIVKGCDLPSDATEAIEAMLVHSDPREWWRENVERSAKAEPSP